VEEKRAHPGLAQDKRQLMRAIDGIHVHQDNTGQSASELKNRPFGAVGGPHSGAVAGTQSERQQASRDALRLVRILSPGESNVLVAADERDAPGKAIRSFEESFSYRLSDDSILRASRITLHRSSFHSGGSSGLAVATQLLYVQILHLRDGF
jgi:hypothetical protein